MYIHRVILKGVPGIPDRDLTFFDDWTGKPLQSVLLTGPNGTGKTTILRMIGWFWELLGTALARSHDELSISPQIANADLVALEIRELMDRPMVLYWGSAPAIQTVEFDRKTLILEVGRQMTQLQLPLPGLSHQRVPTNIVEPALYNAGGVPAHLVPELEGIRDRADKLRLGERTDENMLPNMVFLRADDRSVFTLSGDKGKPPETETLFRWFAEYEPRSRRTRLEMMLRNLKLRDPEWFNTTLSKINSYLGANGKQLTDFDDALRLRIETGRPYGQHYIEDLSSGEQQCLILIFMVSRWMMPGGVVLIDEPDLHLHGSWQRSLIHELEQLVAEKNGQLIVTSHSALVVEEYREAQRFHLEPETQQS